MSQNRFSAKRDENEPEIVDALRKAGYFVSRLNGTGIPDLLVIEPGEHNNSMIHTVDNVEDALTAAQGGFITLLEVKMPGKKLNKIQREWHDRAAKR